MESTQVAEQPIPIRAKPMQISLLAFLLIGVYGVLWYRKRKSRRKPKTRARKKSS